MIKTKYLTRDDYFNIKGINLAIELNSSDDNPNDPERLIKSVEMKVISFLKNNYNFDETFINSGNLDDFKQALCEQIEFEISNGNHAGIDSNAKNILRAIGFMNYRRY